MCSLSPGLIHVLWFYARWWCFWYLCVVCAYFQMTRSAPPERNVQANASSESGRHTASARQAKSKRRDTSAISVEDVYQFAERERLNYSTSCRRQNLAHAQSQTQFFRHEQSLVASRPNTSVSRHMNASRHDHGTPVSAWSEPMMSRPSSIIPHPGLLNINLDLRKSR